MFVVNFRGVFFVAFREIFVLGKIHLLQLDSRKLRSLLRCHGHSCRDNCFFTVVATIPFFGILCLSHFQQNERLPPEDRNTFIKRYTCVFREYGKHSGDMEPRDTPTWSLQRDQMSWTLKCLVYLWKCLAYLNEGLSAICNICIRIYPVSIHIVQERYNIHAYCGHLLWGTL